MTPGLSTLVQPEVFVLGYGIKDHLCELRGAMVGALNTKLKALKPPVLSAAEAIPGEVPTHRPSDKLTGRALGVTPKANGPAEAWANGVVLERTIWDAPTCAHICVRQGEVRRHY